MQPSPPAWLRRMAYGFLLLAFSACTQSSSESTNWENINYAAIACGDEAGHATAKAGCKSGDDNINAIGKGKK